MFKYILTLVGTILFSIPAMSADIAFIYDDYIDDPAECEHYALLVASDYDVVALPREEAANINFAQTKLVIINTDFSQDTAFVTTLMNSGVAIITHGLEGMIIYGMAGMSLGEWAGGKQTGRIKIVKPEATIFHNRLIVTIPADNNFLLLNGTAYTTGPTMTALGDDVEVYATVSEHGEVIAALCRYKQYFVWGPDSFQAPLSSEGRKLYANVVTYMLNKPMATEFKTWQELKAH